jgi:hypothetical protein
MEMTDKYLRKQINRFRLWITDEENEISQVNEEFCELIHFKQDHNFIGAKYRAKIRLSNWVLDNMNSGNTEGWKDRLSVMIVDNGFGEELPYKILSGTIIPDPGGDHTEYHALVEPFA